MNMIFYLIVIFHVSEKLLQTFLFYKYIIFPQFSFQHHFIKASSIPVNYFSFVQIEIIHFTIKHLDVLWKTMVGETGFTFHPAAVQVDFLQGDDAA